MAKTLCLNGTMVNTENYSLAVPLIGVYIAAANLVCFILIFCDVISGFRLKKPWFPCRFFSLNSITITFLSVATKVTVDLTGSMPRAQDQVSKLTGTVFICLTMGFIISSTGVKRASESYGNLTALSIFVITVVVNIGIQISTGVIFTFIVEHSIVLFCMLLLLARSWFSAFGLNDYKEGHAQKLRNLIKNGDENLLERLKVSYLYGYCSSLPFVAFRYPSLCDTASVCCVCLLVLIQAILRSFLFKALSFCGGVSDYGWSMWLIVVAQILTIVLLSLAIGVRWLTYVAHFDQIDWSRPHSYDPYLQFLHFFTLTQLPKSVEGIIRCVIYYPLRLIDTFLTIFNMTVPIVIDFFMEVFCKKEYANNNMRNMKSFDDQLQAHDMLVTPWMLTKCVQDMQRWTEMNRRASPKHVCTLLSTTSRSQESLIFGLNARNEVSSLSLLLLVEVAKFSTPASFHESLTIIFDEVIEVITFIDYNKNTTSAKTRLRSAYAKIIQKFGLNPVFKYIKQVETKINIIKSQLEPNHRLEQLCKLKGEFRKSIEVEANEIIELLYRHSSFASNKELYEYIQRLFVDMLHILLAQLPDAIYNHLLWSSIEDFEDKVRFSLGLVCKFEWLESHLRLSFPTGSNITSLGTNASPEVNNTVLVIENGS